MHIAIIGAGYWGKNLVRNFYELKVLKYVYDTDPAILTKIQKDYPDVQTISNIDTILNDDTIQGVVIATPASTHFKIAKMVLNKNKDLFIEKPLSLNVHDGQELISLAKKNKQIIFVGHILHYHPAVIKMKELINNGTIGRIEYIYSNRLSFGKIRREENILWSFAPHDISLILDLVKETPCYINSIGSNFLHSMIADITMSNLKFPSGIGAHIFVSWLNPFKEQRMVIVGDDGMLVFEDSLPLEKKLIHYPHVINWKNGQPLPEKAEGKAIDISSTWIEPLKNECNSFLKTIKERTKPITSGEEGLKVLEVLQSCQQSIETKKKISNIEQNNRPYFIHETATVDNGAEIGDATKVWHYSHIMKGAILGKNCIIGQNVNIDNQVVIGNNVKIQNNVSVYTGIEIEDDVFLGPSVVLTNISNPRSQIKRHSLYEKTLIKKGATIGANSTIVCNVTIGKYAFIAAGSVVTKDIPDYALVMGNPATQKGWMSRHGHRLTNSDKDGIMQCPESGYKYQIINNKMKCLNLDENKPLPKNLRIGETSYQKFKTEIKHP